MVDEGQEETPVVQQPAPPQTPSGEPEKPQIKLEPKLAYAILVVLLLLAGGSLWLASRRQAPPVSTQASPTPTAEVSPTPSPTGGPTPTKTPTPTPTPVTQTKTINSTAALDGFRSSNGAGNPDITIRAGRNVNLITRGFVSFDLGSIPSGATIKKATLRLYQTSITGNPYGVGGSLKVDHLDYGGSLENADYGAPSISASFGTLTSNAVIEWKDLTVTDQVKADTSASRTRSQFRLHFATETIGGDVTGDFANFESANNSAGTGNLPQLIIEYQ